jgi:hypothetical protein
LRGTRKALKQHWEASEYAAGRHHWDDATWNEKLWQYLETIFPNKKITQEMVNLAAILVYPTKAKKGSNSIFVRDFLNEVYGYKFVTGKNGKLEKVAITRLTHLKDVFDKNNKELLKKFFNDKLIRQFWPVMIQLSDNEKCERRGKDLYFKTENAAATQIKNTLQHITYQMAKMNMKVPKFWAEEFPAKNGKKKTRK